MSFTIELTQRRLAGIALVIALITAGCAGAQSDQGKELAEDTGENLNGVKIGESYYFEVKKTEKNQEGLVKNQPPEGMDRSLERQNLKNRNEYLNDQNNQHYVYLMSHGKVVTWFTASGKVSSVNSKLTNDEQIVRAKDCSSHQESEGACFKTVESPQMDGSYGTNGDAIFFFTTDGRYVQWNGQYLVSEQPLNVQTPPELTQQVEDGGDKTTNSTQE